MNDHSAPCWRDHSYRKLVMSEIADLIVTYVQAKGGTVTSYQLLIGQMRGVEYLIDGMGLCSACLEAEVMAGRSA